ncbi:hypothetical protein OBBRIDRAFT_768641 [Obba rivulosa]|uniref:Phosphatidylinositol N-acetylglucosaminyltransferase subunit H conserved domain-containing protein n=1 Tax=Obba rivulosa TaxID=1052685 RepID=A0A8E2DST6_9APHY|nr:hypothetical protein OBBRIDRAFT_768641 [Obba rivulosa]
MRCTKPLADHPEFSIIDSPGWREFRVQNPQLMYEGTSTFQALSVWSWADAGILLCIAVTWPLLSDSYVNAAVAAVSGLLYLYLRCTQVLWESVIALPSLGLQFESHRGLPSIPLTVSRRFIPLSRLQDFVINEGIYGWNIRYYAVALHHSDQAALKLDVAFENMLPHFPVLLEVYQGIHKTLFASTPPVARNDK